MVNRDALRGLPTCQFKAVQLLGCGSWHGPAPPPTLPAGSSQAAADPRRACQCYWETRARPGVPSHSAARGDSDSEPEARAPRSGHRGWSGHTDLSTALGSMCRWIEVVRPSSQLSQRTMAPRKRSRQDSAASSSAPAAPTSRIDETHAAQLARHLAGLRKLRRFTDLKV